MRIFRPSVSPPRLSMRQNDRPEPRSHTWTLPSANADYNEVIGTNPNDFPVPKRSRLPFPPSSYPSFHVNNSSGHDDTERELQAKAKRLARFKDELSQTESSDFGNRNQKAQQLEQSVAHKRKFIGEASDVAGAMRGSNLSSDHEDHNSSTVIIGTCTDMCPEQERAERERKGDLDQYERLDGDRNQTSTSLAIKKYTRTAEREAALIRPMPILQKTMDYLLNLLDQPYDDKLLGIYNFLWDRMRAIRMDLRMQHIFNLGAITMLEQMIRLHIIAMHELCQYTKGEGFSEGFDAHLNIEQMNKTSVELFQLYDDHRKKEIFVPSEKEFRGYYALLKLDKHPGYKVEPAELSLDLAKMTPEIRQAAEVLFARDVARACRTGNFIAFFRLAKKASYLQACLMHAHFGKLRTQALASLHSGLQNNQGVPVTQVALWLGMEEENIEHLLEYHGFFIKEFEEPYMVKEGPFLNADHDYPLKCSKLVHMKRSSKVVEDVSSSLIEPLTPENLKELQVDKANMREVSPVIYKETQRPAGAIDSDMADYVTVSSAKDDIQVKSMSNILLANGWNEDHHWMELVSSAPGDIFKTDTPFGSLEVINTDVGKPSYNTKFRNSLEKNGQSNACAVPPQDMQKNILTEKSSGLEMDSSVEDSMAQPVSVDDLQLKEPINMLQEVGNDEVDTTLIDEEVAQAKLKLILRIWRKRSLKKKDLREQRRLAANAALSSLSLGPPMWQCEREHQASDEFNIDHAMSQRYEKQGRSWSTLNVSSLIAAKLGERNQYPRCICWKLILCSSRNPDGDMLERGRTISYLDPLPWLRCKLMPDDVSSNDDLLVSLPGLSIWKNWIYGKSISDLTCCLSVVREMQSDNLVEATVAGTSAVMFILSEGMPWEVQKICLYDLLSTIPSGSSLPLLIVSASYENPSDPYTTVKNLGLDDIDKTRICSFSVISLVKNDQLNRVDGFFVDEQLKKGLEWLASESPLQPAVRCVKTRESVLTHLNNALDVQEQLNPYKVNPEHCVLAINGALDQTIEEIGKAAKSNPICWPCPEISLLSQSSDERKTTELYLPSIGWSSSTRIEPLIHALGDCKLPNILKDTSWWCKNSDLGIDIQKQRQELEDYLVTYLTCLMGLHLARKEASVVLQNCVGLELHGSSHYIVPNWLMIFQRVFNWQVMNLSNGTFATAYVLEEKQQQHNASIIIPGVMGKLGSKAIVYESRNLISPSLDEMLEVCCSSNLDYQGFRPLVQTVADTLDVQMVPSADDSMREERNIEQHGKRAEVNGSTATETSIGTGDALVVESKNVKETDRLSKLLEQCNIVQNMIDQKLSIYF